MGRTRQNVSASTQNMDAKRGDVSEPTPVWPSQDRECTRALHIWAGREREFQELRPHSRKRKESFKNHALIALKSENGSVAAQYRGGERKIISEITPHRSGKREGVKARHAWPRKCIFLVTHRPSDGSRDLAITIPLSRKRL